MFFHPSIATTVGSAQLVSRRKSTGPSPTKESSQFTTPARLSRKRQATATATIDVTTGKKYATRKDWIPGTLRLTSIARNSGTTTASGVYSTRNTTEFRSAWWNRGSTSSRSKFSVPTNVGGLLL